MTLIDGDRIVTAQLYDDEYEEFTEKKMSIIDFVNAYSDEGVTAADVIEQPKWIEMPIGFKCSNCNELEDKTTKYCSNCGARMVDEQESGDKE